MANIHFDFRRGGGAGTEILYGEVSIRPTTSFARGTSLVVPANTTLDLVDGEATLANVAATPAPVEGSIEWAYVVKVTDRLGKSFEWMVGVPDTPDTVEFANLPRYYETKPPLFGQGPAGPAGDAGTITVGTVVSGTEAQVTNSGTNQDAILDFVLPKGDKGDTGAGVPDGGSALQYVRRNSGNTTTEWVSASGALATTSAAGFMGSADKTLLAGATEQATANTLVKRSADGRVLYADPVALQNPVTMNWFNNNLDTSTASAISDLNSLISQALRSRFVVRDELTVNVMDHGAVGDGATDDRGAVLAALELIATAGGGTLFFPAGRTFIWSQIVELEPKHSNTKILGYGASIGKIAGAARYAIFSGKSMGAKGYGSGVRNVTFEGIRFFGDLPTNRDACAFAGNHADGIKFVRCIFDGMQHKGHVADLGGCSNISFEWCDFLGSTAGRTGNDLRAECIQLDISAAGAASAPDEPGSWDGLPTKNVTVEHCQFLPKVIGGTKYPAPKPFGSHARRENAYFDNLTFMHNYIEDPLFDVTSELPGDIHFVGARNVKIMYNTWKLTTPASHIAIGFYSYDRGTLAGANNEESGTPNPVVQISPQPYRDIEVSHNKFYGFSGASLDRGYVQFRNFSTNFEVVIGENIRSIENFFECVSTNAGMNAVLVEDTKNAKVVGDTVKGKVRAIQARRVTTLVVTAVDTSEPGTQSINLTDCNGFSVVGNALIAGGTISGILVNSGSSNGAVMGNSIGGGSTTPTAITGTNVTATGNVVS